MRDDPPARDTLNHMVERQASLDATFAAVSDSTRREILAALTEGEASVTELAEPFDVSLQAVSKHIGVLSGAGLVAREKRGRVQWCRLRAAPMKAAGEWIGDYREFWDEQLDSLEDYLGAER
jgi:DNA-binding transcriptional ArsR family regulator